MFLRKYKHTSQFLFFAGFGLFWTQINDWAGMLGAFVPIFWVYFFFPGFIGNWKVGLCFTVTAALVFEATQPQLRGMIIPVALISFLYIYHRRTRVTDEQFGQLLIVASLIHLATMLFPATFHSLGTSQSFDTHWLRVGQEWLLGQLSLFILFPILSIVFWWFENRRGSGIADEQAL